jgi:adenosylhomocysteine nucleosidase
MKIGIMGAMNEEVAGIIQKMSLKIESTIGGRTYYDGRLDNHAVTVVFSRWGKVASAITAANLITQFHVDHIIFIGVAGAADPSLNIGDIVIADQLVQHDMNTVPLFPRFEIPLTNTSYFKANQFLLSYTKTAITQLLPTPGKFTSPLFGANTQVREGTTATGDQFMSDAKIVQELLQAIPNLLCFDMEGAAVAQTCQDFQIPLQVIRIISDKADHSAHVDFPTFIKTLAAPMGEQIIRSVLNLLPHGQYSSLAPPHLSSLHMFKF